MARYFKPAPAGQAGRAYVIGGVDGFPRPKPKL